MGYLLRYSGINAIDDWIAKLQVQPELASGISSRPPAGITLIQHPGRLTWVILLFSPVARLHMVGFPARKKKAEFDAEIVPQPWPRRANFQPAFGLPVCKSYARGSW